MGKAKKLRSSEGANWLTYLISGKHHPRVPYGQETHIATVEKICITCYTEKGKFHLLGCDWESCPACGRQAISCDCE